MVDIDSVVADAEGVQAIMLSGEVLLRCRYARIPPEVRSSPRDTRQASIVKTQRSWPANGSSCGDRCDSAGTRDLSTGRLELAPQRGRLLGRPWAARLGRNREVPLQIHVIAGALRDVVHSLALLLARIRR